MPHLCIFTQNLLRFENFSENEYNCYILHLHFHETYGKI